MKSQCRIVQAEETLWLCLASFQVLGQTRLDTTALRAAPLNRERLFCCRDSSLTSSGFKCGVHQSPQWASRSTVRLVTRYFETFQRVGKACVIQAARGERMARNDGLQNTSCNTAKSSFSVEIKGNSRNSGRPENLASQLAPKRKEGLIWESTEQFLSN
jgi:hypothetical protein